MSILANRRAHIREREAKIREDLGRPVTIRTEVRVKNADYDEFYGSALDGGGDGYTTTYTDVEYDCNVFWITESEQEELPFGNLEIGNCILYAALDTKTDFKNAEKNKWQVTVDDEEMIVTRVMRGDLDTEISIHLVKQKKSDE